MLPPVTLLPGRRQELFLAWPRPPTEEPGQPSPLSRMASLSEITVGLQQLGQPSADAYHQLPSRRYFLVSPENPDLLAGMWNSLLPLLRLDPYLSRAFSIAPPHLASHGVPLSRSAAIP